MRVFEVRGLSKVHLAAVLKALLYTGHTTKLYQVHIDTYHPEHDDNKIFICEKCSKSFIFRASLYSHNCKYRKVKRLECNECDKIFETKHGLEKHVKAKHLVLKPYECDQCVFVSPHKSALTFHVKTQHEKSICKNCRKPLKLNEPHDYCVHYKHVYKQDHT